MPHLNLIINPIHRIYFPILELYEQFVNKPVTAVYHSLQTPPIGRFCLVLFKYWTNMGGISGFKAIIAEFMALFSVMEGKLTIELMADPV
ncbi:MAG: hypothetical protein L3J58_08150 [Emcibacter sp.]|nr:hypothetical protein [Emcibacter sp.]